jgi:hypothetical protein
MCHSERSEESPALAFGKAEILHPFGVQNDRKFMNFQEFTYANMKLSSNWEI